VYLCYTFFTHSLVDGHLGLTTVNRAAVNMGVQVSLLSADLIPSGMCPGEE
jgi:hypothetical protein